MGLDDVEIYKFSADSYDFCLFFIGLLIESLLKLNCEVVVKSDDEDDLFFFKCHISSFWLSGNKESGK